MCLGFNLAEYWLWNLTVLRVSLGIFGSILLADKFERQV